MANDRQVDISGLDRVLVLEVLFDMAKPQPYDGLSRRLAVQALATDSYVDWIGGRCLKVRLPEGATSFDPSLYDRENGDGTAALAIALLRRRQRTERGRALAKIVREWLDLPPAEREQALLATSDAVLAVLREKPRV